ncbi:hypothetical protein BX600DRAFT_541134 [Xylariales sp. PMI_506]|nr:hypothetical protein BX600DRAFT_541134 [Xylariales sp. PMI_506]
MFHRNIRIVNRRGRARHQPPDHTQNPFAPAHVAEVDMASASEQTASPLFARLPAEVRQLVFQYALSPTDDPERPFAADRVYCRPGYRYLARTDTSLLRSCKRAYAEARLLPVAEATHTFWLFGGPFRAMRRGGGGGGGGIGIGGGASTAAIWNWTGWQASLNADQQAAVRRVHVFAQQYCLEGLGAGQRLQSTLGSMSFRTRCLRLTLRHSDWWSWTSPPESSDRLGICPWLPGRVSHQAMLAQPPRGWPCAKLRDELMVEGTWGWQISQVEGLETLEIEFETDIVKKAQMEKVLDRVQHWIFPLLDRRAALVQAGEVEESQWEGPANLKDDYANVLNATPNQPPQETRTYYVAVMTWKALSEDSEEFVSLARDVEGSILADTI